MTDTPSSAASERELLIDSIDSMRRMLTEATRHSLMAHVGDTIDRRTMDSIAEHIRSILPGTPQHPITVIVEEDDVDSNAIRIRCSISSELMHTTFIVA